MDLGLGHQHRRRRSVDPSASAEGIGLLHQLHPVSVEAGDGALLVHGGHGLLQGSDGSGILWGAEPPAQPAVADYPAGERGRKIIGRLADVAAIELGEDIKQGLAAEVIQTGPGDVSAYGGDRA